MNDFHDNGRGFLDEAGDENSTSANRQSDPGATAGENRLLSKVEYQIIETPFGRWRRFLGTDQKLFEEFKSHASVFGLPLVHFTRGRSPETGKRITARGIIAIGRFAIGLLAIGQVSGGLIAVGQVGVGLLFGLGQATCGVVAIGQLGIGVVFALAQFGTAYAAIGQFAYGEYVIAQFGLGTHVLDMRGADPVVLPFFRQFR